MLQNAYARGKAGQKNKNKNEKKRSPKVYMRFYCFSRLLTIHWHDFRIFVSKRFRTGAPDETERGEKEVGGSNRTYPVIYYSKL